MTIEYTGLIPSEITTLGIKFGEANQNALLFILALIIAYFLVAFSLYAASDFLSWRIDLRNYRRDSIERRIDLDEEGITKRDRVLEELRKMDPLVFRFGYYELDATNLKIPISVLRAAFEFLLPLAVGVFAITVLVF